MDYDPMASPTNVLNLQVSVDLGKISWLLPYKSGANLLLGYNFNVHKKRFKQKARPCTCHTLQTGR